TRMDARVDTLLLPSAQDFLTAACPRDSIRNGQGMLYGRVRDERSSLLAGAAVTVTWPSSAGATSAAYSENTIGSLTNDAGYWRVCGVPHDVPLALSVASDSGSDARDIRLAGGDAFAALDLVARRQVASAAGASAAQGGRALVEIAVTQW